MVDPIGTQGSGPRPAGDLDLAFQGGEDFLSRIRTMETKRAQYEKALQEYQLGSAAVDALAQASQKLKEADTAHKAAIVASADAQTKADRLVQDAQEQAARVSADARTEAERRVAEAEAIRQRTLQEAANIRQEAIEMLASAKRTQKEAEAAETAAREALDSHRKAIEAARAATEQHENAAAMYHAKIERLNSLLAAESAA